MSGLSPFLQAQRDAQQNSDGPLAARITPMETCGNCARRATCSDAVYGEACAGWKYAAPSTVLHTPAHKQRGDV